VVSHHQVVLGISAERLGSGSRGTSVTRSGLRSFGERSSRSSASPRSRTSFRTMDTRARRTRDCRPESPRRTSARREPRRCPPVAVSGPSLVRRKLPSVNGSSLIQFWTKIELTLANYDEQISGGAPAPNPFAFWQSRDWTRVSGYTFRLTRRAFAIVTRPRRLCAFVIAICTHSCGSSRDTRGR
jgi:hypothetical protein